MRRNCVILALIALLILSMPLTAFAAAFDETKTGSITLTLVEQSGKQPVVGAEFYVYHLANVDINAKGNLNYRYTDTFDDCDIPLEDPQLAQKLSDWLEENTVAARRMVTDFRGTASCTDLPLGLYLVKPAEVPEGYSTCAPFLVTVPIQNGTDFTYDVNAAPKTDITKLVDITVKKVWNTDKDDPTPGQVTVQLLRHGTVVETAVLSRHNHWQVIWEDLPESDGYTVKEVYVPKGYTPTYSRFGYHFVVTNTPALAQTGQLVWPIPLLAVAGLALLTLGAALLRKRESSDA